MNLPPQPAPDVTIHIPLPNVDITEQNLHSIRHSFQQDGVNISIKTEEVYPVAPAWVEIALWTATFYLGNKALDYYAEKLIDTLHKTLKSNITTIYLTLSKGNKNVYIELPREPQKESIIRLKEKLEEVAQDDEA